MIAPKVLLSIGSRMRSWLSKAGLNSARAGPLWDAYCSVSDPRTRAAFLRTLRSVVDYRGQSVSALGRLRLRLEVPTLVIWGERDRIIPVEHGSTRTRHDMAAGWRCCPVLGTFPHVQAPTAVVTAIEEFIAGCPDAKDNVRQEYSPQPPSRTFATSEDFDVEARGDRGAHGHARMSAERGGFANS